MRAYELLNERYEPGMFVGIKPSSSSVSALTQWVKENNIPNASPADHLHVTILFSKDKEFPWTPKEYRINLDPSTYKLERFGPDGNVLVLSFQSKELADRHYKGREEHNISWDYDEYKPHITLAKDLPSDFNIDELSLPSFPITLENEYIEKYEPDLKETAGVGTIQPHNTTVDVKPGEVQRQAKKWGWDIDKDGNPPLIDTIHKRRKK